MNKKTFNYIVAAVTAAGILSIIALAVYTYCLYKDCSIISYIANKG